MPDPGRPHDRRHHYCLHGLLIESALELPHLRPAAPGPADVTIAFEAVEPLAPDAAAQFRNWTARPGEMVITALGSAHFRVTGGNHIAIDALPAATADDLVSFTLGSAMSALLQQRGLLPLHASSVVTDQGALLITGRSGAGKSTLVAELVRLGLPLLADDVTAIGADARGRPVAMPGLPALRLWRDALERIGEQPAAYRPVRDEVDKYYLPIAASAGGPQPVRAIVRLATKADGPLTSRPLERTEQMSWLARHVHRKHFMPGMGLQSFGFDAIVRLARHAPMIELTRPTQGVEPAELARTVLGWLEAAPARRVGHG